MGTFEEHPKIVGPKNKLMCIKSGKENKANLG
jgi:hypothetical protein